MPVIQEELTQLDYKSIHRDKLEARNWRYLGSMEHMLLINGEPKVRWKHYFTKGRKICVTGIALKIEKIRKGSEQ
jgi:hypothetical protein